MNVLMRLSNHNRKRRVFLVVAAFGCLGQVSALTTLNSSPRRNKHALSRRSTRFSSTAWHISQGIPPVKDIGQIEPLRIPREDVSFVANSGVPTFALRNADLSMFQTMTSDTMARGLEGCLQPASHGPAFVLDNVLPAETCQSFIDLLEKGNSNSLPTCAFGQFATGKNNHGALQMLVSQQVADAVSKTIVPHIDMEKVQNSMIEQEQQQQQQQQQHQPKQLTCIGLNRRWRVYRYAPGGQEQFAPHIDAGFPPSGEQSMQAYDSSGSHIHNELVYDDSKGRPIVSRLTVLLYLNDDFVGGETNFYAPLCENNQVLRMIASVRPVRGSCLVFPQGVGEDAVAYARQHWPLHEGSPVLQGSPKYVIRSDVLFLEETQDDADIPPGDEALFQYDHLVRSVFKPHLSSSVVDPLFLRHVENLYNPQMGVENIGQLLYSFVRFTKTRRIVEIGAGYTSLFILKALQDNDNEMQRIHGLQHEGKCKMLDWPWTEESVVEDYSAAASSLICIDNCLHQKETASGATAVAESLGLGTYLKFIQGDAFELELPSASVDVLWCDFGVGSRMRDFVANMWSAVRPGGFLLCHSTLTNRRTRSWLEGVRRRASFEETGIPPGEFVEISLLEPHKHYQNSITILQKRVGFEEPLYSEYA